MNVLFKQLFHAFFLELLTLYMDDISCDAHSFIHTCFIQCVIQQGMHLKIKTGAIFRGHKPVSHKQSGALYLPAKFLLLKLSPTRVPLHRLVK